MIDPALIKTFKGLVLGEYDWPLFLYGGAGRGKTRATLALCDIVANRLAEDRLREHWPVHVTTTELVDYHLDEKKKEHFWQAVKLAPIAVLDEVGVRNAVGDLHYETTKKFCDLREEYNNRRAVYVSNKPPKEIVKLYDDRIYSRMCAGGTWLELKGKDLRAG